VDKHDQCLCVYYESRKRELVNMTSVLLFVYYESLK
jgi:hypothetical protein